MIDDRPDARLMRTVQSWGIRLLENDARLPETLTAAGLLGAAALISVQSDDLRTLETALLARELAPDLRVVGRTLFHAAIVGVAETDYLRGADQSILQMILSACMGAIKDAGLKLNHITSIVQL